MKLKPEYERYASLERDGHAFNPDDQVFYAENPDKYQKPEGFETWEVVKMDFKEYCRERLKALGISDKANTIELQAITGLGKVKEKIFSPNAVGDIEILQYSLKREYRTKMSMGNQNTSASNRELYQFQKRLHPWHEHVMDGKYDFTTGQALPFWPPKLVKMYENGTLCDTLVLTEGYFKAMKGSVDGINIAGLSSITHYRNRETNTIHPEIPLYIKACGVSKLVILWDGDCRDISTKDIEAGKDLAERPGGFYASAKKIHGLLRQFFPSRKQLQIYFATVNRDFIPGAPKGIDDLLEMFPDEKKKIVAELDRPDVPGEYFRAFEIENGPQLNILRAFFNLSHVTEFFRAHQEKINNRDFVFFGTTYRVENSTPIVKVDANVKSYKRIGPDYFKIDKIAVHNDDGEITDVQEKLVPWKLSEIIRDHGKNVVQHIEKFNGFTNLASHTDYQKTPNNRWNLYHELKHDLKPGPYKYTDKLLRHIFQEQYEMCLDYLTVLYTKPYKKLPIICLVSKHEGTGKSTFVQLLQMIFKQNMAIVAAEDISAQWTSHWISKLVVACEETFFEKKEVTEKIKNLSTAFNVTRRERFVNEDEIQCMLHFVFCSNHEDDFIKLTKNSSRFWVRKVPVIQEEITDMRSKILEEIPHFLYFLLNREIKHPEEGRMWFKTQDYRTEAFFNVVNNSIPGPVKELREKLQDEFMLWGVPEIHISIDDIRIYWSISAGKNSTRWFGDQIREHLNSDLKRDSKGVPQSTTYKFFRQHPEDPMKAIEVPRRGKFFVFKRSDFLDPELEKEYQTMIPFPQQKERDLPPKND